MKHIIMTVVIAVVAFVGMSANNSKPDKIMVQGVAERIMTPDKMVLKVEVNKAELDDDVEVEDVQVAIIAKLQELGIDPKTKFYLENQGVNTVRKFFGNKKVTVKVSYNIEFSNAVDMMLVIDLLESMKVKIYKYNFTEDKVSNKVGILMELRSEAIVNAKERADKMLKPLGQNVGKMLDVQEMANRVSFVDSRSSKKTDDIAKVAKEIAILYKEGKKVDELKFLEMRVGLEVNASFEIE